MTIVHDHIHPAHPQSAAVVKLKVERGMLARRRWRGVAEDGAEFGFDLEHPLADGDFFDLREGVLYQVEQTAEPVLEIPLAGGTDRAARLGWTLGNLHFPIEVLATAIRVMDDPAIRLLCEREHLPFEAVQAVFHPLGGSAGHGHSHSHAHSH